MFIKRTNLILIRSHEKGIPNLGYEKSGFGHPTLGVCLRRLSNDWKQRYGTKIILVETFVDTTRYVRTCYKAANWLQIGQTKGRSRMDRNSKLKVPVKSIFVYPMQHNFRELLTR